MNATSLLCAIALSIAPLVGHATTTPSALLTLQSEIVDFFSGEWSGAGAFAFASGKAIEADVSFDLDLDGRWLRYRHADRLPNRYKALGMWGIDRTRNTLVMTVNDSFGGARTFTSSGWNEGTLMFDRDANTAPLNEERFIFQRIDNDRFRMSYEVRQGVSPWRMVDALEFSRRSR